MNNQQWNFKVDETFVSKCALTLSFVGRLSGIEQRIEGIPFIVFLVKFNDYPT